MGLFFIYSLKVALCLTAFYLVYKLLLSRETFFGFNRAVLLGMVGVSLILPLVRFTVDNVPEAVGGFIVVEDLVAQAVAADAPGFSVTAVQTCFIIYIIGVAFFFGREAWSLFCLRRLMRGGRVAGVSGGVRTIVVQGDVSPFSWMGNIVISEKDYADNPRCILMHELAHIVHPDHSPAFHALVRATLPHADALRVRMREFAGVTTLLAAPGEDDA